MQFPTHIWKSWFPKTTYTLSIRNTSSFNFLLVWAIWAFVVSAILSLSSFCWGKMNQSVLKRGVVVSKRQDVSLLLSFCSSFVTFACSQSVFAHSYLYCWLKVSVIFKKDFHSKIVKCQPITKMSTNCCCINESFNLSLLHASSAICNSLSANN